MATQLVPLEDVQRLSPLVIRILGGNPGKFTLQGTNTYLIGTGPHRILIDTGEGLPTWTTLLSHLLASERATITLALLTHWHPDHTLGESAIFTGDAVLGHGTAVFEDLPAYMASLERMRREFAGRAYPAHGAVVEDGRARIDEELVKVVYKDVPESLHEPAERGVVQVLGKLEGEGKVVQVAGGRWELAGVAAL
ncbi:MAG: hypothetical protein FRX48_07337 [Lasallia pustulata]|uniref:Metallo-beta-lactamase domain-containing protein n=1 Tax=Lasallia pustulata TaxID=136370 RepID=A0A5M8PIY4_9LECA|nr:MAG: hypothetical protein FRX48_07337 [Lasallia pustulata]